MKNTKNKRLNNSGFSLVELIIVIAIMAVLVGVLAPQYLKYVEKSRESADLDNYQAIISAIEIYAADPANNVTVSAGGSVSFTKNTAKTFSTSSSDWVSKAIADAGIASVTMKSTSYGAATVTVAVDTSTGYITIKTDKATLNTALGMAEATTPTT